MVYFVVFAMVSAELRTSPVLIGENGKLPIRNQMSGSGTIFTGNAAGSTATITTKEYYD